MMDGMTGMGLWMVLWALIGLALLVAAVLGIVWLVRDLTGGPRDAEGPDAPEHEIRRRFATGEIGPEEYQQLLTDLRTDRPA